MFLEFVVVSQTCANFWFSNVCTSQVLIATGHTAGEEELLSYC